MIKQILFTLAAILALNTAAQTVTNPATPFDWPDPTLWKAEDGNYYCMATGARFLLKSSNLLEWQSTDIKPFSPQTWEKLHTIGKHLWAPDVAVVNGQRIAYVTMYNAAEDASIVALRETAPGHFEFASILTQGKDTGILDTIDPEVITDPADGRVWLFFGSIGGVHRIELTPDGLALKPGSTYQHVAGLTYAQDETRLHVFEGSYLHKHGDYWYLFVSSGWYNNETYRLSVGRSRSLDGIFTDREGKPMTQGYATPILQSEKGDRFVGPGHCGEITTNAQGQDIIIYHCHDLQMQAGKPRPMLVQQIFWDEAGWPYFQTGKPETQVVLK